MARLDHLSKFAAPYLKQSETLLGAIRATARGSVIASAMLGGAGAGFGYLIGTSIAEGMTGAVLGGAVGAAAGMAIGAFFARFRMKRAIGVKGSNLSAVITGRRILMFTRTLISSRPSGLGREIPLKDVASMEVGAAKLISPHPLTITLTDGSVLELEVARIEKPDKFVAAYRKATRR